MTQFLIEVVVDPRRATTGAKKVRGELDKTEGSASKLRRTLTQAFGVIALGAGLTAGTRLLANFSQEMSSVAAITQATAGEFENLQAQAIALGTNTRFTATQAAEGMIFLARAGFSANEVLETIEGTLQLAQAGALGLGQAADIASNALTAFRLETAETGRVVDVLALAANSSNTTVAQLGDGLKLVAPIAAGLGVEIEEVTGAISALSNAGLQATLAGTGLRRVLSELESPSAKTKKTLGGLGLEVEDFRVSSVGLTGALKALADAGVDTGLGLEIFGDRGGPAFEVLSNSIPDVVRFTEALQNADGTAARIAATMDDNLNGAILATKSAFQGLVLELGEAGATGALRTFFDVLTASLRFLGDNATTVAASVAGVSTVILVSYIPTTVAAATVTGFLTKQVIALNAAILANPFGLAVGSIVAFGVAINSAAESFEKFERASLRATEAGDKFALTEFGKVAVDITRVGENLARVQEQIDIDLATKGFANPAALKTASRYEEQLIRLRLRQDVLSGATAKAADEARSQIIALDLLETAVSNVVRSIEQENELLSKGSRERQIQSALLQEIADLEKDSGQKVNDEQREAIELGLRRNQVLTDQAAAFDKIRGPQEAFNAQVVALESLEQQGRISTDELEAALANLAATAEGVDLSSIGGAARLESLRATAEAAKADADAEVLRARVLAEVQGPLQGLLDKQRALNALVGEAGVPQESVAAALERTAEAIRLLNPEYARQQALITELTSPTEELLQRQADLEALILKTGDSTGVYAKALEEVRLALSPLNEEQQRQADLLADIRDPQEEMVATLAALKALHDAGRISAQEYAKALEEIGVAAETSNTAMDGFRIGLKNSIDEMTDVQGAAQDLTENGFRAAEDAMVSWIRTGEVDFEAFVDGLLDDIARLLVKQALLAAFGGGSAGALGAAIGSRAGGGDVDKGESVFVGEEGVEIFTPESAGAITPAGETAAMLNRGKSDAPVVNVGGPEVNIRNMIEDDDEAEREGEILNVIRKNRQSVRGVLG